MATEIERKFLLNDHTIFDGLPGKEITQGYLSDSGVVVRVRTIKQWICTSDHFYGYLTIKGSGLVSRDEYEYEIPYEDALEMLDKLAIYTISKTRYEFEFRGHVFEIDKFHGALEGFMMVEVELASEDEVVDLPPWIGKEVSHDPLYSNFSLAELGMPPNDQDIMDSEL